MSPSNNMKIGFAGMIVCALCVGATFGHATRKKAPHSYDDSIAAMKAQGFSNVTLVVEKQGHVFSALITPDGSNTIVTHIGNTAQQPAPPAPQPTGPIPYVP